MDRPYSTYSRTSTTARNAGGDTDTDTEIVDGGASYRRRAERELHDDADAAEYDEYDEYEPREEIYEYEDPIDRRWIWVAGVAGAILLIAIICTVVILGGGDSGSVSKTVVAPTPTTAQAATTIAPPAITAAAPPPAPVLPLSPETVTTVAPSAIATATATTVPVPVPAAVAAPSTVTYQVTGTRPLLDLVTVVYTDAQGALQTEFNVALPWSRTVTLDPGVELKSVIATSLTGQLNCSVTDASGATIVAQTTSSMIAACTK